ncbi:hypothetical protein SH1V18_32300 [Vallitalea longa]|uniref:Uncharacterized protein n=1 Tax=Vallitalea longa TaxID=2936439 RepID=A0A9W6DFM7_9FIRM|nr:DUF5696 domain-containing protein [Vallitalea longa]GKX30750.1 hypothetical protein SH1V18_32300 [Vallitalea longa]
MKEHIIFRSNDLKIKYYIKDLKVVIYNGNKEWNYVKSYKPHIEVESNDKMYEILFCDARDISHEEYRTGFGHGIRSTFSQFSIDKKDIDISFETNIWIDNTFNDVHFQFIPIKESKGIIKKVVWPGPFEFNKPDRDNYTVLPMMQGCIIPTGWNQKVENIEDGRYYTRDAYMPWWGQIEDNNGYIAIASTPWDGGYELDHPGEGYTNVYPYWEPSLGSIRYNRELIYRFLVDCDYNSLCKIYKDYVKKKGSFITLEEKNIRNSNVEKLIGSPIIHTNIYKHIVPESIFYDKENPSNNEELTTFSKRADQLKRLKSMGVEKAYVHLDGWGKMGYDNQHPDILPPCEKAGGFDGMKELTDTCKELDYIFATHDQYRDYYLDAETFDINQAVVDEKGDVDMEATWEGGKQAYLCTTFAPYYVKRNFEALKSRGIELRGSYLDVFSVVNLDECFHKEHKMSRRNCMCKRIECFNYVSSEGILTSSEEGCDWAIPYMNLVHHAPHALYPNIDKGNARGIPVPLLNLVYHDCIVIPWALTKSAWGIPESKDGFLYALLNGGVGYLGVDADKEEIGKNKIVCDLSTKVATCEMISHKFLDDTYNKQKTIFSDGTSIEVDFEKDDYIIGHCDL